MEFEKEVYFNCPYCLQRISMVFEELYGAQNYIEDCEVCCNPIEVTFEFKDEAVVKLEVKKVQ